MHNFTLTVLQKVRRTVVGDEDFSDLAPNLTFSNMDDGVLNFPVPVNQIMRRANTTMRRLLRSPPWAKQSTCALSSRSSSPACSSSKGPPECDSACWWAENLLRSLVPAAHARARQDLVDSFMNDIFGEPVPGSNEKPFLSMYPAADRIIAIGDVHGDVNAMRQALRNARVIDNKDQWVGGKTVLVQVGDQLDRGNRERDVIDLLFKLQDSAPNSGGAVHILLGNHELMNSRLDFRYVSRGGFDDFHRDGGIKTVFGKKFKSRLSMRNNESIGMLPEKMQARARSLVAGGPLAVELSQRARLSVIVGDNLFIHAGLSPKHLKFGGWEGDHAMDAIHEINLATRNFLQGSADFPSILSGGTSPIWMRDYSRPSVRNGGPECQMLNETLKRLGVKRMIVGHTPQAEGINSACGGRVWRIDTGMSSAYGGIPEAIEIGRRGNVKIFSPSGMVQGSARFK